jgi:hypothetical protein
MLCLIFSYFLVLLYYYEPKESVLAFINDRIMAALHSKIFSLG